jgi:hypothetical protein
MNLRKLLYLSPLSLLFGHMNVFPVLLTACFVYSLCSGYISAEMTKTPEEMEHKAMKIGK